MSPSELKEYLAVLREGRVIAGRVVLGANAIDVTFGPEPLEIGEVPAPVSGGWKSPQTLDQDFPTREVP